MLSFLIVGRRQVKELNMFSISYQWPTRIVETFRCHWCNQTKRTSSLERPWDSSKDYWWQPCTWVFSSSRQIHWLRSSYCKFLNNNICLRHRRFLLEDHPLRNKAQAQHFMRRLNEQDHLLIKLQKLGVGTGL